MGHQIMAGQRGIYFTDGAWLVVQWCGGYQGDLNDVPIEAVQEADRRVPTDFVVAKAGGFLKETFREEIGPDEFRECRDFLHYAATNGHCIAGSY